MKRLPKTSELMWLLGDVFVALGVAICSKTDLGVSMIAAPAFVINQAVQHLWSGFSVGVVEYIFQGLLLIIMCLVVRRFSWKYLLAFAVAVVYGYTLDLFLFLLDGVVFEELWLRWVMLIVGDSITALGVACFFRTYLPLQVYELFVSETSNRYRIKITITKWTFDLVLLAISITLALTLFGDVGQFDWSTIYKASFHSIGLGTIVTTIINSPIIAGWSKLLERTTEATPLIPKLEKLLKRDQY